jgi:hypothetical protein
MQQLASTDSSVEARLFSLVDLYLNLPLRLTEWDLESTDDANDTMCLQTDMRQLQMSATPDQL